MPPVDLLLPFLLAALVCNLAPGPDLLGILTYGMSRGRRAGLGFAFGVGLGCLFHTALAVVGISAIIAASPTAFRVFLYAGAAYLIYLGIRAFSNKGAFNKLDSTDQAVRDGFWPSLRRGFITNALNPKVGLFFLAFLPQLIDPSRTVATQLAVLGATFWLMTTVLYTALGYFSGTIGEWLRRRASVSLWLDRVTGCLFIGLGLHLIFFGSKP